MRFCRARIAVLFVFIVWYTADHFSIPFMLHAGAAKPFMFREAMLMFAFSVWFFGAWFRFTATPGKGGYWWVPNGAP